MARRAVLRRVAGMSGRRRHRCRLPHKGPQQPVCLHPPLLNALDEMYVRVMQRRWRIKFSLGQMHQVPPQQRHTGG